MAETGQPAGQQYYCEIFIKETQYNPVNINYLIIREWIFNILPTLELQFIDDGYLTDVSPLEDGEDILISLAKNEDTEETINLIFSLDDYNVGLLGDNRKSLVTLTGHLKVNGMFQKRTRSFTTQNSSSVLQNIATESGKIYTNPRNVVPVDSMVWYQIFKSNFDFIRSVLKRVYIPDDVALFYADAKDKFVFTSLNTEWNKNEIKTCKYDVEKFERNVEDDEDPDKTIWFNSYSIANNSGYYNKMRSYGTSYSYYNLEGNVISNEYSNINLKTDLSFRNADIMSNTNHAVYGRNCCDFNERNLYGPEYFESRVRNKFLRDNFFAFSLVLNINSLTDISLMDKVDVMIPSLFNEDDENEVMSGLYLVAGIQHEVSKNGIYTKKISVSRNGMNKSSDISSYQVEEA